MKHDITQILTNLKLVRKGKLINAAVVLFANEIHAKYSNCMIRLARFKGNDKLGDFIDNQRVYGNAFRILSSANEFALRHLPISSYFQPNSMQRIDQPAVPQLALREAIINAISHRDYANHSATLALAIYDDRLEIWNNGSLPPELDVDALRKPHQSYPRNENLASIFYKRGWVEGWGTGTITMINYCQQNGTPEPEFQEYSGGFSVVFRFKEPMGINLEKTIPTLGPQSLTARQQDILNLLSNEIALSANEIINKLKDRPTERGLRKDLSKLKTIGLIGLKGHSKSAKWFIVK